MFSTRQFLSIRNMCCAYHYWFVFVLYVFCVLHHYWYQMAIQEIVPHTVHKYSDLILVIGCPLAVAIYVYIRFDDTQNAIEWWCVRHALVHRKIWWASNSSQMISSILKWTSNCLHQLDGYFIYMCSPSFHYLPLPFCMLAQKLNAFLRQSSSSVTSVFGTNFCSKSDCIFMNWSESPRTYTYKRKMGMM